MRAELLPIWPQVSARFPFLNPTTVGQFSRAEINEYLKQIADENWSARG